MKYSCQSTPNERDALWPTLHSLPEASPQNENPTNPSRNLCARLWSWIQATSKLSFCFNRQQAMIAQSTELPPLMLRLSKSPHFDPRPRPQAPFGSFAGRPLIHAHSRINGGIYLGSSAKEALVVDDHKSILGSLFDEALVRILRQPSHERPTELKIVTEIVQLTRKCITYDTQATKTFLANESVQTDQRVSLDVFLQAGIGLARHQVLLAAYLIERFKLKGMLKGFQFIEHKADTQGECHERLVYTTIEGDLIVFNPYAFARQTKN